MTTELHYFCVDVETSALRTWEGDLLTIGCTVVDAKGNVVDDFYRRIDVLLHPSWYDESMPAISETQKWWREQNQIAKDEAYMDRSRERKPAKVVAKEFYNFVTSFGNDWNDRRFVSDPDKFDWVWTDWLLSQDNRPDPFWYHGIDMYSVRLGSIAAKRGGRYKGKLDLKKRHETNVAAIPHHALSDSFALARDLCEFLEKQPIDLDAPASDPAPEPVPVEVADEEPVPSPEPAVEEVEAPESEE